MSLHLQAQNVSFYYLYLMPTKAFHYCVSKNPVYLLPVSDYMYYTLIVFLYKVSCVYGLVTGSIGARIH